MIGIYKITHKQNKKSYIGQSIHCGNRLDQHCNGQSSQFIDEIITLEGIEAFNFEIIKQVSREDLSFWEDYYIMKYDTFFPNGYNRKWNTSEEMRQAIKIKLNLDLQEEEREIEKSNEFQEEDIKFGFNKTLFNIYLKLFYLSTESKDCYYIENRKIKGKYLEQFFPNITYNTLLKYLKILKEKEILQQKKDKTIIKNIISITNYISREEQKNLEDLCVYFWYIKYKILLTKNNVFFSKDFAWIYSLNSNGSHDGAGRQTAITREMIQGLIKKGVINLKENNCVHKYEVILN